MLRISDYSLTEVVVVVVVVLIDVEVVLVVSLKIYISACLRLDRTAALKTWFFFAQWV